MENTNIVRVVSATLDKKNLTLYTETGLSITLEQGDHRLKKIVEQVMPIILAGGVAEVDLGHEHADVFKEFTEKSNGVVRFFKAAKSKLATFFTAEEKKKTDAKAEVIHLPVVEQSLPVNSSKAAEVAAQVKDVFEHLEPLTANDAVQMSDDDTIVAVVNNQMIAGVESLKPHLRRISTDGSSTVGVEKFLNRLAAVIGDRRHSVDDLMKFLKRADLPITDDGCILAYKVLRRHNGSLSVFVDCHTKKVQQRVGSYVHMDPKLVDPDRRQSCSNGLHIARRDYISGFGGDTCVLVKVKPEDVIAVPENESSKMRVCGYHILSEVTQEEYRLLKNNQPFTEQQSARKQLAAALRGDHIGITQLVQITGQLGEGLVMTDVDEVAVEVSPQLQQLDSAVLVELVPDAPEPKEEIQESTVLDCDHDPAALTSAPVDPVQIAQQVAGVVATGSRRDQAQALLTLIKASKTSAEKAVHVNALLTLKKGAKVGWDKLGITDKEAKTFAEPVKAAKATPSKKPAPVAAVVETAESTDKKLMFIEPDDIIAGKHDGMVKKWVPTKRKQKKSWEKLGFDDTTGKAMLSRFDQMNPK